MKLERHEVRLRPKYPAEAELIAALAAQSETYGGKNELMRQCLVRGYLLFKQKMEAMSATGTEVAALDALAQAEMSGDYGYRVIKTYLGAKAGSSAALLTAPTEQPSGVRSAPLAEPEAETPGPARSVGEKGVSTPILEVLPDTQKKNQWGRFRGIAGSGGAKGDKE